MNISIDKDSGFCFGVIRAVETAENYLKIHPLLYCLGDIVHNNVELNRLTQLGLRIITHSEYKKLHDTTVLIRAHGEPPETYQIAKKHHIKLIDATCPVVLKLQQKIRLQINEKEPATQILIFGKKGHAEVIGLLGQTTHRGLVVSSIKDVRKIDFSLPSRLFSQTTQNLETYSRLVETIQKRYEKEGNAPLFQSFNTICSLVANRSRSIRKFAEQHDTILFVSGKQSSNGLYLFQLCQKVNPNSHFISDIEQLSQIDFSKTQSTGICGATSTPLWLLKKVAETLQIRYSQ